MKNSSLKKLEEQTTIYITLSMMLSLSASNVSDFIGMPFIEYAMIAIAVVLIILGVLKVSQYKKQKVNNSCGS